MRHIRKKEEGVSPVIAVILMVAITVVLAAVLYVMVSGMMTTTSTTPTGALDFTESTQTTGQYTGSFVSLSKSVKMSDAQVTITDDSLGASDSINDLSADNNATVTGGITLQYTDNNNNKKIDGGDTIRVSNADSGDIVKFVYEPTGGVIAQYTFV